MHFSEEIQSKVCVLFIQVNVAIIRLKQNRPITKIAETSNLINHLRHSVACSAFHI